ncbi:MAG TPA: translocation/assembly module TamB domain-containing protein [Burkholderiaceae bacterium]|nr:translocation/assembly module TamB domain-containing protein [Burkholderiaceae bacterium]
MSEAESPAAPAAPAPPPAPKPRIARRWASALGWTLVPIVLALGLLWAALWWMLHDERGTRWLLYALPGVAVTAPSGSLIGDFAAERVEIALPGGAKDRIVLGGLRWNGLTLAWPQAATSWLRIEVERLQAERVNVQIESDPDAPPLAPPLDLTLPVELEVRALHIGALHATPLGDAPLRALDASLALGAERGTAHRLGGIGFAWDRIVVHGDARIGTTQPFAVEAALSIKPDAAGGNDALTPFDASVTLQGPLERVALQATLRGASKRPGEAPQTLDLDATLLPFAPWPIASLQAQTQALDLGALASGAPSTALGGTVEVHSVALDRPANIDIRLDNAQAGRADEGRLPIRSLHAELRARPDDIQSIEIQRLALELGTLRERGGSITASGHWAPARAQLDVKFTGIAPRALDARAPPMQLAGDLHLQADDWPATGGAPASGAPREPSFALRGRVDGRLPHAGRIEAVQLDIDATATPQRVELRQASVRSGTARAELGGQALRQPNGAWQVTGQGRLADFDPALWWPGTPGSAWQTATHNLNGTFDASLLVAPGANAPLATLLAQAQGRATLRIADSTLAGAALAGDLALEADRGTGLALQGKLALASAEIGVQGRLAPSGANDHWEISAHAADLAPLAPLVQLVREPGSAGLALAGAADASATIDGRWPQLVSRGSLKLTGAKADDWRAESARLDWTLGSTPQAPLDVKLEVAQAGAGVRKLDKLGAQLQGTWARHRIAIDAESPVRPPLWLDQLHGAGTTPSNGTLAELRASGGLSFDPAWQQPLQWSGRLEELQARRRGADFRTPWFHTKDFDITAEYDPLTGTPQLTLGPGRAQLTNLAAHWSTLRLRGGEAPAAEIEAEIEPFTVAPLMARLQPDFGWRGDLVVGGRIDVRSAPAFAAEIEFGRISGDLSVAEEVETHKLELTDLRIALDARDGVWHFTHAMAGRRLGAMASAATVRTDPKAIWPPADAPLQGVMELRIADLAAWGAWVPAGWRLRGALHASAAFGGQFGAPEFTGSIEGSGLGARNLLEGIELKDGELQIALKGETAEIVKLRARGGEGSVDVTGGAKFGAAPQADLRVVADKLLLLGRVDRQLVMSGDATLRIDPERLVVNGRFDADRGLFDVSRGTAPSLGNDVIVLREPEPGETGVDARAAAGGREVDVTLALGLGQALRVRGYGLDTLLRGELRLTTPGGRPAINGTINTYRGTYRAYNQNLRIARGAIVFTGAPENPRLDILALRPNLDINVGVAITGTAAIPRITLYSEPDMPDTDKLSWLVLGRAPDNLGGSDIALLQAAAAALLAGEGESPTTQLTQLIGLDSVSVRQSEGEVRDTVVSVGKQLSRRWYIGYERSLNSAAGNWQLIYRLAQRFTLRLQTGIDNSVDLIWTWRWD